MPYEHKSLASEDCHEPKHFGNATTADAGKVLTPSRNSNGQSELRALNIKEIVGYESAVSAYIGMSGTGNSKTVPFSGGTPVEINSLFADAGPSLNIDDSNNTLTFQVSGVYQILMLPQITANTTINIYYKYNNNAVVLIDSVGTGATVHGLYLLNVAKNDTLQFQARATNSGTAMSTAASISFAHNIVIRKVG